MSKLKIGSNAQFTSTGKGLTVIGEHCYHYSGAVNVNNTDITLTKFTTGKKYILAKWYPSYGSESGDNMRFTISFNGLEVSRATLDSRVVGSPFQWIPLVIPPLTDVQVVCTNKSTSDDQSMYSNIIGRLYG